MASCEQLLSQLQLPSPVTQIHSPLLRQKNIQLFIKRDELIHPVIQGNKWRKLKYNLFAAIEQGQQNILSFGGAYSNHLHALARAAQICQLNFTAVVRGEQPEKLSPTLRDIQGWGTQLEFVSRRQYSHKTDQCFIDSMHEKYGEFFLIHEGGDNELGRQGCGELLDELDEHYDLICCEVGSGTMFSALVRHNSDIDTAFMGFVVMKNPQLDSVIAESVPANCNTHWQLVHDYHFGGFARTDDRLNTFIRSFLSTHHIQLEPVYSGKMLYAIFDLIEQDKIQPGQRILAIHGGGLQGLRGYPELADPV